MTQLTREDHEDFAVVAQQAGASITATLSGTADAGTTKALDRALTAIQIGRASCRERVSKQV